MKNLLQQNQSTNVYFIGIIIIVIIVLINILFILRIMKTKKIKKRFEKLNYAYNELKTMPITFKMNKAIAICKVNEDASNQLVDCQSDFERVSSISDQLIHLTNEIEDLMSSKKYSNIKKSNLLLTELEELIYLGNQLNEKLLNKLDVILEREVQQRDSVNVYKENFREIKNNIISNSHLYSISMVTLENKISNIENLFSIFEEWMYASEFNKTKEVLVDIKNSVDELMMLKESLPELIKETKANLPSIIDELKRDYALCNQKNIYLNNLKFDDNLNAIYETLKSNLANIENCEISDVKEDIDAVKVRIGQLKEQIEYEEVSYYEVKKYLKEKIETFEIINSSIDFIDNLLPNVEEKFGLETLNESLNIYKTTLDTLKLNYKNIKEGFENPDISFASLQITVKEQISKIDLLIDNLNELKDKLNQACVDEERAKKQMIKLQLIANEMRVKTVKNKLPSISKSFFEDLNKANEYIVEIKLLLEQVPLNIIDLNSKLNFAIDFVYKLYNDLNKVVGMALMVENTIVFANKYRTSNLDIDSELTRAELLYRNGEFTQALEVSIAAVEKIFPNSYNKLLKETENV